MAVFLAMMVMPFSRSRSMESITLSFTCSLARKMPLCQSIASTRVVLPWSTWAMMARLRTSSRVCKVKTLSPFGDRARPDTARLKWAGEDTTDGAGTPGVRSDLGQRPHGPEGAADGLHLVGLEIGELAAFADPRRDLLPGQAVAVAVDADGGCPPL